MLLQDVRVALAPLARMAEQSGAAVVIVRHLTKSGGANVLYRGGGSIGIIAAARTGLLVAKHPDSPEHERVLAATKSNLGPPMPSLRFRLVTEAGDAPQIEWLGDCDQTATTLLAGGEAAPDTSALDEACDFLRACLSDGPRPALEMQRATAAAGIAPTTLKRAQAKVGVSATFSGFGAGGRWM